MLFTPIGTIHSPFPDLSDVPIQPIGLSLVRLLRREGGVLWVSGIDVVDGTPLLDIKPYVPECDACETTRIG